MIDFLCKSRKLIVEVDGSQHSEGKQLLHDVQRDAHFRDKGYRIVRLWNGDINRDADAAAETVLAVLNGDDPFETAGK